MGHAVSVIFIKSWCTVLLIISIKVLRNVFVFLKAAVFYLWKFSLDICGN